MLNLDYLCAKYGQEIGEEVKEKILQKALGVLREDGVYALFLWLEDKEKRVRPKILELLKEDGIKKFLSSDSDFSDEFKQFCKNLRNVTQDIDKLLFFKKILERTLTYALYHAKVKGENDVEQG